PLALHSFPTRRSSDLSARPSRRVVRPRLRVHRLPPLHATAEEEAAGAPRGSRGRPADAAGASNSAPSEGAIAAFDAGDQATARRSEEHTSELQSPDHL